MTGRTHKETWQLPANSDKSATMALVWSAPSLPARRSSRLRRLLQCSHCPVDGFAGTAEIGAAWEKISRMTGTIVKVVNDRMWRWCRSKAASSR